tara:strand:- start:92 stop:481 length:390 start_codon:yes stop_codon:yes gene_type:complete
MKNIFIIILNILLFSLIFYNIIGKTNNIIENLTSKDTKNPTSFDICPETQKEDVFSCTPKMNRLFRELNTIKRGIAEEDNLLQNQNRVINVNMRNAILVGAKAQQKGDEEEAKLDKKTSEKENELNQLA